MEKSDQRDVSANNVRVYRQIVRIYNGRRNKPNLKTKNKKERFSFFYQLAEILGNSTKSKRNAMLTLNPSQIALYLLFLQRTYNKRNKNKIITNFNKRRK